MPEREAMPRYKLVPVEPSGVLIELDGNGNGRTRVTVEYSTRPPQAVLGALFDPVHIIPAASPEPTPEMVAFLCRCMWPDSPSWDNSGGRLGTMTTTESAAYRKTEQAADIARMLAFLKRIGEQP